MLLEEGPDSESKLGGEDTLSPETELPSAYAVGSSKSIPKKYNMIKLKYF